MSEENNAPPSREPQTFSLEYVRELRAENKGLRLKAQEMETRANTAESAAKTADERVAAAKAEADAAVKAANEAADAKVAEAATAATTAANQRVIDAELRAKATALGMRDLDGLKLADLSTVKLNDKGELEGADALLTSLKEAKPYFFGDPAPVNTSNPLQPPKPNDTGTNKKAKDWTPEQMKQAEAAVAAGKPIPTF